MAHYDQPAGSYGGEQQPGSFAGRPLDLSDPNGPDFVTFTNAVMNTPAEQLRAVFMRAAEAIDPADLRQSIMSGDTGTDQFGTFDRTGVAKIARELFGGMVACYGPAFDPNALYDNVPGIDDVDPELMSAADVTSLAEWMRLNEPQAFAFAGAELAVKEPGLLPHLLGQRALRQAAIELSRRPRT